MEKQDSVTVWVAVTCAQCGREVSLDDAQVAPFGHPKATQWLCSRCMDIKRPMPQETKHRG
jgi:hypothetical protein